VNWDPLVASGPKVVVKVGSFIAGVAVWMGLLHKIWEPLGTSDLVEGLVALVFALIVSKLSGGIYDLFDFLIWAIRHRAPGGGSRRRR
jgi:hypothetical protein